MGEVYRAYDESQKRIVALKLLSPHLASDESYRARFRRESELAARLREAHVIPIHRYGEIEGRLFLDMRLVEGSDLAKLLEDQGALPAGRAVAIISQVARALDAAHADRLIHRDVKPSNVLVSDRDEDSDDDFVYLVDFGIARAAEDEQGLTKTGSALGSFDYMAPERFLEGTLDRRTDVYSLACLLYECLTGKRPFPGNALPALMYGHLNTAPPRPTQTVSGLPAALDDVISNGMAKKPENRFARAGDLAAAARRALRTAPGADLGTRDQSASQPIQFPSASSPPSSPGLQAFPSGPNPVASSLPWQSAPHGLAGSYVPSWPPPSYPGSSSGPITPPQSGPFPLAPSGPSTGSSVVGGQRGLTKGRAALVVGTVAALVAAATIWALVLTESDPPANTTTSTSAVSTTATTTSTSSTPDPQLELLDLVPADFPRRQCAEDELAGDGDIAKVSCGASLSQPGPTMSTFYLYEDQAQVSDVFESDMAGFNLALLPSGSFECNANAGYATWAYTAEGGTAGYYSCRIAEEEGVAIIQWTEDEYAFYGAVFLPGGAAELAQLWEWWQNKSAVSAP